MKEQFTPNRKLIAARLKRGWKQQRAADACRVGERTYRNWERGRNDPSLDSLHFAMDAFGLSAQELGYAHLVEVTDRATPSAVESFVPVSSVPGQTPGWYATSTEPTSSVFDPITQLTVRVFNLVGQWRGRAACCAELQMLLSQEFYMFDSQSSAWEQNPLSRRQALMTLAALPSGLLAATRIAGTGIIPEEFLPQCTASITACWHLMQGQEFLVVEQSIAQCLPALSALAQQSSPYQRAAAGLASQGYLLLGLVSLHQQSFPQNVRQRLLHCKQAVQHAEQANDPALLVASLIHLGSAEGDLEQFPGMLRTHQSTLHSINDVTPFLQSKAYAELAHAYAKNGQTQDALIYIGKARELFPETIAVDTPSFLSTDYGLFSLILFEGQTLLNVGVHEENVVHASAHYEQAQKYLEQIEAFPSTLLVPERFRVEVVNRQALAAIKVSNLEQFRAHLIDGAQGAKALHSGKRQQEVITNWREARKVWPHEPQVLELADLLLE